MNGRVFLQRDIGISGKALQVYPRRDKLVFTLWNIGFSSYSFKINQYFSSGLFTEFYNQAIEATAYNIMGTSYLRYLHVAQDVLRQIEATQTDAIAQASEMCAETIAADGLVYLFGSGHSRMAVEEIFPRYGSFPGFFPIVELAVTFHNQVVGCNGQRQALFLENVSGYAEVILRNFTFGPHDRMMVFSNSGTNIFLLKWRWVLKHKVSP